MNEAVNQVVLITGASSGIGQATARLFAERKWTVFGTDLSDAAAAATDQVRGLVLDVRSDASVAAAVAQVLDEAGRIDVLVNNAGYAMLAPLEEISAARASAQFEVNFFGIIRMVNAVLPAMRARGAGRIVNIGSVAGLVPVPYGGIYCASKHAVEGYSRSLDLEVRQFGIRVTVVEPNFMRTGLGRNAIEGDRHIEAYDAGRDCTAAGFRDAVTEGGSPAIVAETVWRAATARRPRARYPVGAGATTAALLRDILPRWYLERRVRSGLHLH